MVMKVLFLTFCMGIGICMGTEPPSEPFQGTFEQSKHSIAPVRLILHGRGTFEFYRRREEFLQIALLSIVSEDTSDNHLVSSYAYYHPFK